MVIIGATIASLHLAYKLKKENVSVVIIDEFPALGVAHFLKGMGSGRLGLTDNVWRLHNGLGTEETQRIIHFSRKSLELAREYSATKGQGGYQIAYNPKEREELIQSCSLLEDWGISGSWYEPESCPLIYEKPFLGALYIQDNCTADPTSLFQELVDLCASCDIPIAKHTSIVAMIDQHDGISIQYETGMIHTDLIVYAHGTQLNKWESFFAECQTTIRSQAIALKRTSPPTQQTFSTQYGYIYWRDWRDLRVIGGCRWASPHLETGETDDRVTHPKVEAALLRSAARIFCDVEQDILFSWSRIEYHSCDGLPIVGPLPGSGDRIAMTSLLGRDMGLGFACAEAVYDIIIKGRSHSLPPSIQSRRLI